MSSDELVDDAARDMTAMATRPALRGRVIVAITVAPPRQPHRWLVPAMAGAAGVAIATWLLIPARLADEIAASTTARQEVAIEGPRAGTADVATGRMAETVIPASVEVPRATFTRPLAHPVPPAAAVVETEWADMTVAEIPMLPPLAVLPPVVIEPITWDEVMIAPIEVKPIEVKALVMELLDGSNPSGV